MKDRSVCRLNSWEITVRNAIMNTDKVLLAVVQTLLFTAVWRMAYQGFILSGGEHFRSLVVTAVYFGIFLLLSHTYGGFHVGRVRYSELVYSLAMAQMFAVFFQYLILCVLENGILNPLAALAGWVAGILVSAVWAMLAEKLFWKLFPPKATYIIYQRHGDEIDKLRRLDKKFSIQGELDLAMGMDQVLEQLWDAEAVFLCGVHASDRNQILKYCIEQNIQVYIRPRIGDLLLSGSTRLHLLNMPFLHCGRNRTTLLYEIIKRTMDIILSGIALVMLSPVMIVTAVLIHHYDGGPAFYRQTRLTKDGNTFEIMKFRSMRVDAEKDGVARLASEGDSRITPIGAFIRKVRLDELPQLINILKGDMSIVGPRPERPEIAAQYEKEMPEFSLRLQVKGGLTGYAQVYGKYNTKPYDKLQMDLIYIENQSVLQDVKLIFATVKVLFMKESTEGVADGQVTAAARAINSDT